VYPVGGGNQHLVFENREALSHKGRMGWSPTSCSFVNDFHNEKKMKPLLGLEEGAIVMRKGVRRKNIMVYSLNLDCQCPVNQQRKRGTSSRHAS